MKIKFEHQSFAKQVKSMLAVDFRRMFTMPFLYIMIGCCLVMPILILVMTTMMDGSVTVNPQTGAETVIKGFDNTWQAIGSLSNAGLSFEIQGFTVVELVMCMLAKILLVAVFVPIYLVMSVIAKEKTWLSIMLSMMTGMFLFMMIPMITPLDATIVHVILCLAGGILFSMGLGTVSVSILRKKNIV